MKKFNFVLTLILLATLALNVLFYFDILDFVSKDNSGKLNEMITHIAVIESQDTTWDEDYDDEDMAIWGTGTFVNINHTNKTFNAFYLEYVEVANIEINYTRNFITQNVSITSITVNYVNLDTRTSVEITWSAPNTSYATKDSIMVLREYFLTLTMSDIRRILLDRNLLDK